MSIILSVACPEGIVMASEGRSITAEYSEIENGFQQTKTKITYPLEFMNQFQPQE